MLILSEKAKQSSLAARERAANELVYVEENDNAIVRRLAEEAKRYDASAHGGRRMECYALFDDATSLWLLQTVGLPEEIQQQVDLFATTTEDLLAKALFLKLPTLTSPFPPLDRTPIAYDSDTTVHLVVVGFSAQAEALALHAALVAHYPNYCRDTKLRTRITLIDDHIDAGREQLTQRYHCLFDHSYYRTIDLNEATPRCLLHRPLYEQRRKDFVDIEWEFVNGNVRNEAVRQKLTEWSSDPCQQLTLALCHADQERNYSEAFSLPQELYQQHIPVFCRADESDLIRMAAKESAYATIHPFGTELCDLHILRVLKQLAQRVNYVYNHCFALAPTDPITAPSAIDKSRLEPLWRQVGSLTKQYSNLFNAMTLATKMHSIGHAPTDWQAYYALTMDEINLLTAVEHNRWSVEELILGYRPTTDEEQQLIERDIAQKKVLRRQKIHYDLRAYDDLRADVTGKNVNVYDRALTQGIPLIIKSCITD